MLEIHGKLTSLANSIHYSARMLPNWPSYWKMELGSKRKVTTVPFLLAVNWKLKSSTFKVLLDSEILDTRQDYLCLPYRKPDNQIGIFINFSPKLAFSCISLYTLLCYNNVNGHIRQFYITSQVRVTSYY